MKKEEYSPMPPCWLKLDPSRTFLIADPHLLHSNLTKMTGRPEDFTERILRGLENLTEEDTLIVLGDLALSKKGAGLIGNVVAGRKILIKGNHDRIRHYSLDRLFDVICLSGYSRLQLKKNVSLSVYFFHYPVSASRVEKSIGLHVDFVVSGHTHKPPFYDPKVRVINLSPEVAGYEPFNLRWLAYWWLKNKKSKFERLIQ